MHSACQSYGYPTTLAHPRHHSSQSFRIAHIRCLWLCALFSLSNKFLSIIFLSCIFSCPGAESSRQAFHPAKRLAARHRTGFNEGRTSAPSGVQARRGCGRRRRDGGRKWPVIFCLIISSSGVCVQHGWPPSVISGGARAGHDMSNDTVVKNAFFSNLKKT